MRYRNSVVVFAVVATLVAATGCQVPEQVSEKVPEAVAGHSVTVSASAAADAVARLATLAIRPEGSMAGYSRKRFRHWIEHGDNCNTRELVLQRQGTDIKRDSECRVTAGRWVSPYDGKRVDDGAKLDIDHLVPLAEAWRSGARDWTDAQRERFANDLDSPQLVAVTAAENRAKGDQDPARWRPPDRAYWCAYAIAWVVVKVLYRLHVDQEEHDALKEMLDTCPR